jgi:hypothetical protein
VKAKQTQRGLAAATPQNKIKKKNLEEMMINFFRDLHFRRKQALKSADDR